MRTDDVPAWFTRALETPVVTGTIGTSDGRLVGYRKWGHGETPLVLVHGGAAHARWWDHIGPLLLDPTRTVIAVDLAGHGDSDPRAEYTLDTWADDVVALATDPSVVGPRAQAPFLVGHSMGGLVTWTAAARRGSDLAGVVAIDAPIGDRGYEVTTERIPKPHRRYPSRAAILARFRTLPPQDAARDYVIAHVAETSVRQLPDGWVWKHDPAVLRRPFSTTALPERDACRLALLLAEQSIVRDSTIRFLAEGGPGEVSVVDLPGTAHHMMLDEPLTLAGALRVLLQQWAPLVIRESIPGGRAGLA